MATIKQKSEALCTVKDSEVKQSGKYSNSSDSSLKHIKALVTTATLMAKDLTVSQNYPILQKSPANSY